MPNLEVIIVKCFELLVADGGGMRNDHYAYIASEADAKEWVSVSPNWRSYIPFEKKFVIASTLRDLDTVKQQQERERALAKLSPRERTLLGL